MSEESGKPRKRSWREAIGDPKRRRLLVGLGIAAVAIIALIAVPGYLATRPSFMARFSYLDGEYAAWSTSVHSTVACQQCHVDPGPIAQTAYAARMLGEYYLSILPGERKLPEFAKPTKAACSTCHIDLRTVSPSGDLNIPHRAHVTVLGLECVQCHDYLVHAKNPSGTNTPTMAACLKCHDGKQAKNACSTCHTDKAAPASHRASDWTVTHPRMQQGGDCAKCHKWWADWCAECHSRRPKSHTAKWRSAHGEAVKTHRNCEACHEAAFCITCHGEVPKENFDPALKLVK